MNKISAFVVAASVVLASSSAFAGGMVEPEPEPTPVVVDGGSSSVSPLWLLLGGGVAIAVLVGGDSSSPSTTHLDSSSDLGALWCAYLICERPSAAWAFCFSETGVRPSTFAFCLPDA